MSDTFTSGDQVEWDWGEGTATGTVEKVHTNSVTKKIKGTEITRNGKPGCPAYTIRQDDGDVVLKLHSEVRAKG